MTIQETWRGSLTEAHQVLGAFLADPKQLEKCQQFTSILVDAFKSGHHVYSCGNGGSHCDAMHFAEEFTGKYRKDRKPLGALALGDASHVTCVANDFGFDHIFSRQLQAFGKKGDVLVALSTSGNSKNILKALEAAREMGVTSVALLGRNGGAAKDMANLSIVIPAETSDRIQEMHIKILHTVIETVERKLFPENY